MHFQNLEVIGLRKFRLVSADARWVGTHYEALKRVCVGGYIFVSASDISVLLAVFLLYMLILDNFFVILSYSGCFGRRTLLKNIKENTKILVHLTFKYICR